MGKIGVKYTLCISESDGGDEIDADSFLPPFPCLPIPSRAEERTVQDQVVRTYPIEMSHIEE